MVAELWTLKMGNQVSSNIKHALYLENSTNSSHRKQGPQEKQTIGILSFEVANVMSKVIQLHKSLTDNEILKLKIEILKSEGIKILVISDEKQLLELALAEKLDDLNWVSTVVSRLGKKCTIPALQGFEHVYGDVVSGMIDTKELGFLVKDMESMVQKMERYVNSSASLYTEMEVMNELEVATKKFQQNQHEESRKAFEQKLTWQKQDVRHLKNVSLWNQTYDKVVELLARAVCTIYARIHTVFGDEHSRGDISISAVSGSQDRFSRRVKWDSEYRSGPIDVAGKVQKNPTLTKWFTSSKKTGYFHSGDIAKDSPEKRTLSPVSKEGFQKNGGLFHPEDFNFACGMGPGRLLMECLRLSSSASKVDDDDQSSQISGFFSASSGMKRDTSNLSSCFVDAVNNDRSNGDESQSKASLVRGSKFGPKNRLVVHAPPSTVGGSAIALHYANIIIVLEKLLCYPHLVGDEARDDLYQMLPTSLRKSLKTSLKSCIKDLAIYDAHIAHDWKEKLGTILKWLAPLAHNMIRWLSERNFEQQQIVTKTNVLLLQTLYFADREKTESAICELLVGLNYICRYEQQQNALLDCASSFGMEDCMEWQLPSFNP